MTGDIREFGPVNMGQSSVTLARPDYDNLLAAAQSRDLRRWCVEQAVQLTVACIPMPDDKGNQQGIVSIATKIEAYVLNGAVRCNTPLAPA